MNLQPEAQALFQKLAVGDPVAVLGVHLVPLLMRDADGEADALLLEEAIAAGEAVVNEVNESGVVGQVRVLHRGQLPLLVLQGEQILGAKQNRSFNASFIVAPGKEAVLPVSCVEQGRWQRRSTAFEAGATTLAPEIRARKLKRVSDSIRISGSYDANQHRVWSDVREYLHVTGSFSTTGAYEDARRKTAERTEHVLATLEPQPGQAGLAVVRDGRVVLLDVFGSPKLFARAFRKCLRGALSDVPLQPEAESAATTPSASELVKRALETLACTAASRAPSVGDGDTWTGRADSVAYAAAVWGGQVYHCAAAG